ncbi:NUDIX hydrolase [Paenibacillus lentus]|uniref:NUDIX hydrolase n=1 Tax=Paenibacillus lentus TaxID=1338368 RepID=A0A3S8RX84_9BACL|nr:NUDIX hydrolase [Paenibacillus lentus]AZK47400.1 NUDIX hydrolase [Paenibacillus lentus]
MRRVDVVYTLLVNEEGTKILMVKNSGRNSWTLPGGTVEPNETLEMAAVREAKEETGLDVQIKGVVAVNEGKFTELKQHVVFITFRGVIAGGRMEIARPDEILAVDWIDVERADELMPFYKEKLRDIVSRDAEVSYYDEGIMAK